MCKMITVDIGNSVFKVSGGDKHISFNSKIKKIDINTMDFTEAIVFDGDCYAIGQGDYVHSNFKASKEYLEQFILYAINCVTDDVEVNLMLNLPVNQVPNKEILKSRLQGKEYEYTLNSPSNNISKESKILKINKVGVVGESIASYYSLGDELSEFITILDIGSKTINYATFTEIGINDISKSDTLDFGIHDLYQNIIDYYKVNNFKTYTISDIDSRLKAKKISIPQEIKIDFVKKIKNNLNAKGFFDIDDYSIKCCGGGAILLGDEVKKQFSDVEVLQNPLFRNNIGTKLIAESIGF